MSAFMIAACGSDEDSAKGGSSKSAASPSGLSAETQQAVDAAYKGNFGTPPASSPKPQAGKNIWLISFSASIADYKAQGQLVDAAKALGWKVTVVDGKFDPGTVVSGMRQAIADGADGIITAFADCPYIKAGLQDAKKANIPVVGIESLDCNQAVGKDRNFADTGQPGLFTAQPLFDNPSGGPTPFPEFYRDVYAPYQALGIAAGTKGKGKVIALNETDVPFISAGIAGFEAALKKDCPACEIVETVDFVGTDLGGKLQEKVAQALTQHPDANAVYGIYDAPSMDVATAVVGSGRKSDIFVMGGEGTAPVVDLIHEGRGVNAAVGYSVRWEGWSAVDALNRLFGGEKPAGAGFPSGMGAQLFDADHALPAKGQRFDSSVDFEAAYRKAWGVG